MLIMKMILRILFLLALAYVGFCILLYVIQRRMIYHPTECVLCTQQNTMTIPSADGEKLMISTRVKPGEKAILYFGGNAEDVSLTLPDFADEFPDHALYFMHYRGYGGSGGSPSEKALISDAAALFDFVQDKHRHIVVIGRSLGTGVATPLAATKPVSALILITPFDSVLGVASTRFPYIPVSLLLHDTYNSGQHAPKIRVPTTLFMAEHDEIIPRQSTEQLFSRFDKGIAKLITIPDTGHNDISDTGEYLRALKQAVTITPKANFK